MLPAAAVRRTLAVAPWATSDAAMVPPSAEVLRCVPHRAPILRVHTVVANDGLQADVLGEEPDGPGRLPWAAGAIEGLAQSAALLLAHGLSAAPGDGPRQGMLVAVKRFTVAQTPPPQATIAYHVRLVRRLGPTALVSGHAEAEGVRLAAGELTLWTSTGA